MDISYNSRSTISFDQASVFLSHFYFLLFYTSFLHRSDLCIALGKLLHVISFLLGPLAHLPEKSVGKLYHLRSSFMLIKHSPPLFPYCFRLMAATNYDAFLRSSMPSLTLGTEKIKHPFLTLALQDVLKTALPQRAISQLSFSASVALVA